MSSYYLNFRPTTVSGEGLFKIKLSNPCSNFENRAKPAINIEELNSGLYVLRRLAVALEASYLGVGSVINPNNRIFPGGECGIRRVWEGSAPASGTISGNTVADIKQNTAKVLVTTITDSLNALIEEVSELPMTQVAGISAALVLMASYQQKPTLNETEQAGVFGSAYIPSDEAIKVVIKKEKEQAIQEGKDRVTAQLAAQGASDQVIADSLNDYEEYYVSEYFNTHVKQALLKHRANIGENIRIMLEKCLALGPNVPVSLTKDNVKEANAKWVLKAWMDAFNRAMETELALGGDRAIIEAVLKMIPYATQTNLSDTDINAIYTQAALPSPEVMDYYLTSQDAGICKGEVVKAFQQATQNLEAVRADIEANIEELEVKKTSFQQAQASLESMLEGVKRLNDNKAFTSVRLTSVMECYAGLLALSQMSGVLEANGITLITKYVNQFLALKNTNTTQTLANVISYVAAYCEVAESTMANTILQANKDTVVQKVKAKFQELQQRTFCATLTVPPDSELQTTYIEERNGVCQAYFNKFVDDVITKNLDLSSAATQAQTMLTEFQTKATEYLNTFQTEIDNLKQAYEDLDPTKASFNASIGGQASLREKAVNSWIESTSLGSAFIHLILNTQIPKQENFLNPLIQEVNFNNVAANAVNDLLSITNNFSTSSVYYNLSSYLVESREGQNYFCGDFFEFLSALAKEREYIARDINSCYRAQEFGKTLLAKVEALAAGNKVTAAQANSMRTQTNLYLAFIQIIVEQLAVLDSLLRSFYYNPLQKDGKYDENKYEIKGPTDWISTLASLEGYAANGFDNASPSGGLGPMHTLVQTNQHDYLTQSQTQQLNLQNQMTNIQQEWTLVSTSMQVLNGILSHLAAEIYTN
ncbi:CT620/CT621 family type III secretion system effector [Chlamydia suis]|uniref:Effector from type III secretion system family protein n=1 Tax=Chlamydia suis TaxID=83559 RepID=A0AAQ0ER63_9CHLA|nr:CT620/CT621 family type III secretion system effector [Chlamydia suis]MEB2681439.1 CT620/CT621 family type III secretion system effector [Chlamydia suis]MEB2681691.1 CT620/CT621 family type III secretion system effector [Chlamydia suis]MEB2682612.1 CT620/CT621 family type III secretion system effector [Chlamydia suis]MEB2684146.1 CT620/CT621 family type III secretion system effector [Chlamydia suis]MEB2684427.1 CT620/CT621 family type III secretion system effector [Chlamydia suis]